MVYTLLGIRLLSAPSLFKSSASSSHGDRKTSHLSLLLKNHSSSCKIFAGKSSFDSESPYFTVAASEKVLVTGSESNGSSSSTDQLEIGDTVSGDSHILPDVDSIKMEDDGDMEGNDKHVQTTSGYSEVDGKKASVSSPTAVKDVKAKDVETYVPSHDVSKEKDVVRQRSIPPPGTGQRIYEIDPLLTSHREHLDFQYAHYKRMREEIDKCEGGLEVFSRGYEKFGFTRSATGITYREWAPGAMSAALIGDFNNWNPNAHTMTRNEFGVWEIFLPNNADGSSPIPHGSRVKIHMDTPSGIKDSIPAWIKFSVQAPGEIPFNAIYYDPPEEEKYVFKHPRPKKPKSLRIYESHVGMSSTVAFTGNYNEYFGFATDVDAVVYLMLVNDLIHGLFPEAISIGEDVSGMPAFCIPVDDGGIGFDYRLHMAIADKWIELLKKRDEDWRVGDIVYALTNRRWLEKCVAYAESHDQALVGDKTIAFWLMDKDMYDFMALDRPSTPQIDRGIALHKMIRLITMGLGGEGYLNFMGNEFGHPEWIDFPRGDHYLSDGKFIPGNGFSYDKCRRRFDLGDADYLRYHGMQEFDQAMQHLEEAYGFMTSEHQYISRKDEGDRMIIFERGNLVFVFNFHWNNSYSDYRVGCLHPGKYKMVLDSDELLFGGFNRLDHNAEYFTFDGWSDNRPHSFLVYAPCRTAVVYALVEDEPKSKPEPEPVEG
ncbi:hypothetical protein ACSBR2_002724 [Camellia fascicularis]